MKPPTPEELRLEASAAVGLDGPWVRGVSIPGACRQDPAVTWLCGVKMET